VGKEVLQCGFGCICVAWLLTSLRSRETDSASWSVTSCGRAQTKCLPTSKFSMYKVDRCGSDFSTGKQECWQDFGTGFGMRSGLCSSQWQGQGCGPLTLLGA